MRQAFAVSRIGREPRTFMPWEELPRETRPFSEFRKKYGALFRKKKETP